MKKKAGVGTVGRRGKGNGGTFYTVPMSLRLTPGLKHAGAGSAR